MGKTSALFSVFTPHTEAQTVENVQPLHRGINLAGSRFISILLLLLFTAICFNASAVAPVITSFSPTSGTIGTAVTITGTNFSTTPADNIVYFGAVKATVGASTATSITITVPAQAGSVVPVSVMVGGLTAFSATSTTPTFNLTNTPNLALNYTKSTYTAGTSEQSVAIGDFNGDGKADLAVANFSTNDVSILLGNSAGSFGAATNFAAGTNPYSVAIGDFNSDGKADLAVANYSSNNVSILLGIGDGSFGTATNFAAATHPVSLAIGDLNGDGKADLAVANGNSDNVSILLGNGAGSFSAATNFAVGTIPMSIAIGDFNGDGKADLAVANYTSNNVSILLGIGTGSFGTATNFTVGTAPYMVAIGDFNGDGKADLAVANANSNNVSILLGNGAGSFGAATDYAVGTSPHSVAIGDFNGDGKADIISSNSSNLSVLLGDGAGSFAAAANWTVASATAVSIGDFNGDGKADIVSVGNNVSVLLYTPPPAITSATYDAATGTLVVTGTDFVALAGTNNDIIVSKLTITGDGTAYTLTTSNVEITNGTGFTVTLNATDKTALTSRLNKNGTSSTGGTTYNLAAAEDWDAGTATVAAIADLTGNGITISNVPPPTITSFSPASGTIGTVVTITGTNFSTTPANNIVYFGAVQATVSASTATTITVTVPAQAGSIVPVSVMVGGLTAYAVNSTTPFFNLTNTPNLALNYTTSSFSTGASPQSVAIADFNGDGKADIATASSTANTVSILLGNGAGSFGAKTDFSVGAQTTSIAIGDFNGDGNADIATANNVSNNISILLGNGDGSFGTTTNIAVGYFPTAVAIGDFNGDGKADIVVTNRGDNNVSILPGNGDGSFGAATNFTVGSLPVSVAIGDFNGDGKADLAVANYSSHNVSILLGNGSGSFGTATNFTVGNYPDMIAIGDFNSDGRADLAVTNEFSSNISILLGNVDGSFGTATNITIGTYPSSVSIGDFNGDGKADIIASWSSVNLSILLGDGTGSFAAATNWTVGYAKAVAVGDFNGDGKADMVSVGNSNVYVLLYTTPPAIASATYNAATGTLVVTGTDFAAKSGTANDIVVSKLTLTGEGGAAYTLTSGNVEIYSSTQFTVTLNATDKTAANLILNKNGTSSISGTNYNLAAAEDWDAGTAAAAVIADLTGNGITVSNVPPIITSFSPVTGIIGTTVTITGTGFDPTPVNNSVYFGAVKATVSASSSTTITVAVPAQAGSVVHVSVMVGGLTAYSMTSTTPTFNLTNTPNLAVNYTKSTLSAGSAPFSVAIGDFNGDGNADLAAANYNDNNVSILLGNGAGSFGAASNFSVGTHPQSTAIGDFNGDGKADLAVANWSSNNVSMLLGNGDGTFGAAANYAVGSQPYKVTVGDFNGDGKPDLATANTSSNYISVLSGNGDGTFGTATNIAAGASSYSAAIGDFNGDGKVDIATAGGNNVGILLGNGDGTFSVLAILVIANNARTIAIGDFNGDSKADITIANMNNNTVSVLLGNGDGSFSAATNFTVGTNPISVAIGDFNGDGKADIAAANWLSGDVSVLLGNGAGSFGSAANYVTGSSLYSVVIGDFNGDGKADMVSVGGSVALLLYTTPPSITSATYNVASGALVVTGTGFAATPGGANDIVVSKLTLTGEGGATYTLTSPNVNISSSTQFTVTLNTTDKAAVNLILNKNGVNATGGTTYNLAAAEDWDADTFAAAVIADLTGNGITVSNVTAATDYFRSFATGNWSNPATWQSSPDNSTWGNATLAPTGDATLITVRSPHTVTIDVSDQTAGALVIENGATLTLTSAGSLTAAGNLQNSGILTGTAGSTVTFSGASAQAISGTGAGTFGNLTLSNASGLTLSNAGITVNGTLNFQDGILTTGTNTLTLGATGSITNASSSAYVNGKLAQTFSSTGSKVFPIGKGGNYRPVTFNYTALTGTSVVTAEQTESAMTGTPPVNTTLLTTGRYWTISQTGGTGLQYYVTLDVTGYTASNTVLMFKKDAGTILSFATTASAPEYTNTATLTSLSDFALGELTCILSTGPAPKVADLVVAAEPGAIIKWYAAETGGAPLNGSDHLVTTTDYWASQTVNGCESTGRFKVTAVVNDCYITVTTAAITNISTNTATSGGTISNNCGAAVTASGVCWSTAPTPIATGYHTTGSTATGTFVSNITGLNPGTIYFVRAYTTNTSGTAYGNEVSFMTTSP